jgi:hypothetical protein
VQYNAVLRCFPPADVECLQDNKYETTIFTLASAVTKLSRVTTVPKDRRLWRGLGGMILPEQFWRNFPECIVTLHVTAESVANKEQNEALQAQKETEARDALRSLIKSSLSKQHKLPVEVLNLANVPAEALIDSQLSATEHLELRVVSSNQLKKEGRITVAVPMSKFNFDPKKKVLQDAVATACHAKMGARMARVQVAIEAIADKPKDFRGGGVLVLLLAMSAVI